jgi:hypothetical protein
MPNWCSNYVKIKCQENNADHAQLIHTVMERNGVNVFDILRPMPSHIFRGNLGQEEKEKYGNDNWYDWSVENWGCKWDTDAQITDYQQSNEISMGFDTPWSPPTSLYDFLENKGFTVSAEYYEPGMMFAGIYEHGENRNVELTKETLQNTEDGQRLNTTFGILDEWSQYDDEEE